MARSNPKSFVRSLLAPVTPAPGSAPAPTDELHELDHAEAPLYSGSVEATAPDRSAYHDQFDEDADMTALFLAGNERAFVTLYAKYETPLLVYLKRLVGVDALAEDLFQETWVRVFECRKRRSEIPLFKGFLFRVARNLGLNALRSEQRRQSSSETLEHTAGTEDTAQSSQQFEMQRLLTHALKQLPIEQREAFVLREYSGYTYAEIGVLMGTTEVAAKVRASRARLRLKKFIAGWLGLREDDDPTNAI
jgi:RNA polymerase sigma factor (sigma-70 family)